MSVLDYQNRLTLDGQVAFENAFRTLPPGPWEGTVRVIQAGVAPPFRLDDDDTNYLASCRNNRIIPYSSATIEEYDDYFVLKHIKPAPNRPISENERILQNIIFANRPAEYVFTSETSRGVSAFKESLFPLLHREGYVLCAAALSSDTTHGRLSIMLNYHPEPKEYVAMLSIKEHRPSDTQLDVLSWFGHLKNSSN